MTSAVTLQSLSKTFEAEAVPALHGVNLDILPGTCTAILGPSGSGKSTILRIIAGLDDPSGGQVLLNGVDMTDVLPEHRGIGMVFQRPLLFPHLSVIDNVAFAARAAGMSRARARRHAEPYLEMVHLAGFGSRCAGSLSGGQEQRVALARSLAAHPSVLLLDEPFSALDPALREDMHGLLAEIRVALTPTVILVTHDRDEAAAVADRIAVIENGMLLQHDTVDRVYSRPSSRAVARLMGGRNEVDGTVRGGVHESALGAIAVDEGTPEGPGVLVFRHESVSVGRESSPGIPGAVTAVQRQGARRRAVVDVRGIAVHAELAPGFEASPGAMVMITIARGAASVVPR